MLTYGHCAVKRQSELANGTELTYNGSEPTFSGEIGLEPQKILCAPPVTSQTWQMASGYIGAVLMLVMAVYGRYSSSCH